MRRFEFQEGISNKFWEVEISGKDVTTTWGKIGTSGQTKTKTFADDSKARAEYDSLIREKTSKGYKEAGVTAAAPSTAQAPESTPQAVSTVVAAPAARKKAAKAVATVAGTPAAESSEVEAPSPAHLPATPAPAATVMAAEPEKPSIAWTDALRRKLHPRRNPAAKGYHIDLKDVFGHMTAYYAGIAESWETSEAFKRPEFGPALREIHARLSGGSPEGEIPGAGSVEVEQILPAVLSHRKDWNDSPVPKLCVPYWAATRGLPFALEALLASMEYSIGTGGRSSVIVKASAASTSYYFNPTFSTGQIGPWLQLRKLLAEATEAEWQAAKEKAKALRSGADLMTRTSLSYLFPDVSAWVEEDARDIIASGSAQRWAGALLACVTDGATLKQLIKIGAQGVWGIFPATESWQPDVQEICLTMIDGAGHEALPAILEVLDKSDYASHRKEVLSTVAILQSDEAFEALAARLDLKEAVALASEAFSASPVRAMRALARAAGKGQAGLMAESMLTLLVRGDPTLAETVATSLSDSPRRTLEGIRAKVRPAREEASPEDLPPLLLSPPWQKKKKAQDLRVLDLAPLPFQPTVAWAPGQKEEWSLQTPWQAQQFANLPEQEREDRVCKQMNLSWSSKRPRDRSDAEAREWAENCFKEARYFDPNLLRYASERLAVILWESIPPSALHSYYKPLNVVAHLELRALPGLIRFANQNITGIIELLHPFDATGLALPIALASEKLKKARPDAQRWLFNHAEAAVIGLIPPAVGKDGPERQAAGNALRFLAANGKEDLVLSIADRYGEEARAAVREVLDFDPLQIVPAKIPKMPGFWQPGAFTRPVLKAKPLSLPLDAVNHIGTMLAFSRLDDPYAGLAKVKEACDESSLANFAWDVFSAWLVAGAPSRENWAFNALGHFGDDSCARKLTPMIREWPGQAANARAVAGLDILAAIGTDVALMFLNGIAQKVKFKGLQEKAKEKIEVIAERRGLSPEDLADRLVPDLGLSDDGSMTLDFGPRSFEVGFDEHLRPFVRDVEGKKLPDLPRPVKTDEAEKATAAQQAWKDLKKDVKTISAQQILKLEMAMCSGRRWTDDVFRTFFVEHPLVQHLVRRVVWGVYDADGRLQATFRVAEDSSFADSQDGDFDLPAGTSVGVVHALDLSPEQGAAWGQIFGDYEILQPFNQLGRETFLMDETERDARALLLFQGKKVSTGRVLALDHRGWRRGSPQDGGCSWWYEKSLKGELLEAILELDPGIVAGDVMMEPEQKLGKVTIVPAGRGGWGDGDARPLSVLDPISFSELVRDLVALTS